GFVGHRVKDLMVVGPDPLKRDQLVEYIGGDEFRIIPAANGQDALELLQIKRVDCLVLGAALPDMTTETFVQKIDRDGAATTLPVILYSDQPPSSRDGSALRVLAPSVAFRQVCSPERLLDQTAFFLHSPVDQLPEPKRRMIEQLYQSDQ